MTRGRKFLTSLGTIDELAIEAAQFDGDVLLSCEDFDALIDEPEKFAPLRYHPIFREYEFILLIYLRNQSSYLESLYLEKLKHGIGEELILFAHNLLSDRQISIQEWAFYFDYAKIYQRWAACDWANLIIKNYHQLAGGSIITDFCDTFCPDLAVNPQAAAVRVNSKEPLHTSLLRFYNNRVRRPLQPQEEQITARICTALSVEPVTISDRLRFAFNRVFSDGNEELCSASGIPGAGLTRTEAAPARSAPLERIFSFELHSLIADSLTNNNISELTGRIYSMIFAPTDPWQSFYRQVPATGVHPNASIHSHRRG